MSQVFGKCHTSTIKILPLLVWGVISLLIFEHGFAQSSSGLSYPFKGVTPSQDLPHNAVHHIMQDSYGFIWISTRDGLCRYSGTTCTNYRMSDSGELELQSNLIWLSFEDSKRRLWFGTKGGGLSFYDPATNTARAFLNNLEDSLSLSNNIVTAIFEDEQQNIWVGTDGGGLNKLVEITGSDTVKFERISLSGNEELAILDIKQSEDGKLWLATYGSGIIIYNPETGETEAINSSTKPLSLTDDHVMTLAKEGGNFWVGTKFGGLSHINYRDSTITHYTSETTSLPHDFVWDVFVDESGNKWIGTYGGGFSMMPKEADVFKQIRDVQKENNFDDDFVLHAMQDKNGQFWIATDTQGAFNFKTNPIFSPVEIKWGGIENTSSLIINDLFQDSENKFWLSTNQGLFTADENLKEAQLISNNLGTSIFYDVAEDEEGILWIASNYNLYIYKLGENEFHEIDIAGRLNTPGTDRLFNIEVEGNGHLWLASDGGLVQYDTNIDSLTLFQHEVNDSTALSGNKLDELSIQKEKNWLWVATDDRGLNVFDLENRTAQKIDFTKYLPTGNNSEYVTKVIRDKEGNTWVGTADKGLYKIHHQNRTIKSVTQISTEQGLMSDQIFDIAFIDSMVLVASKEGFSKIDLQTSSIENIQLPQGGTSADTKEFYQKGEHNYLYSRDNIFQISTEAIKSKRILPEIYITRLEVFNEDIPSKQAVYLRDDLNLAHDQNFVSISYTVLNLNPDVSFLTEYILEGHDPYWLKGGEVKTVNYTNLKPGDYTFRVRYANAESTENYVTLAVTVRPPFWEMGWFRSLIGLILIGLLFTVYKYRTYYLLKEERTRNRIARDLHDDLSGTLSSISFFSEAALRVQSNKEEAQRFLGMIEESASEAKEKINDIIWAIDPSKDNWPVFLKKCKRFAADALDSKEIDYEINIADDFVNAKMELELRQNLWLIFKEMINNLVEHAEASKTWITFVEQEKMIYLEVRDNGKGFNTGLENDGHGVRNIQQRVSLINGEAQLQTKPGEGTVWTITVKV